jgi:hypothetical protein
VTCPCGTPWPARPQAMEKMINKDNNNIRLLFFIRNALQIATFGKLHVPGQPYTVNSEPLKYDKNCPNSIITIAG